MKLSATILISSLGAFSVVAQAAPVGMIAHVTGQVTVLQDGKKTPARLLGRLEPNNTVVTGPNSNAVIVRFSDGARFQLGASGRATVSKDGVKGATQLTEMGGPSANAVKLLGSARVGAVMARPPFSYQRLKDSPAYFRNSASHFEWMPKTDAARYTFTLLDRADNVVWSTSTDKTSVDFPANLTPLETRKPYLWIISAFGLSGKPKESSFGFITVLSDADADTLSALVTDPEKQLDDFKKRGVDPNKQVADLEKQVVTETKLSLVNNYLNFGVFNSALEVLDRTFEGPDTEGFKSDPSLLQAMNDLLDSLSPIARTLVSRTQLGLTVKRSDAETGAPQ